MIFYLIDFLFVADFNCNFENGICKNWYQDRTDQLDWAVAQGSTSSAGTGPKTDHSTGTGMKNLLLLSNIFKVVLALYHEGFLRELIF